MQNILIIAVFIYISYVSLNNKKLSKEPTINDVEEAIVNETANSPEDESNKNFINEMEEQWSAYFVNNIQPILEDTMNIQLIIRKLQEQNDNINNLTHQLETKEIQLGVCEENIKTKEKFVDQLLAKVMLLGKIEMMKSLPTSCIGKLTDIYEIKVPGIDSFPVACDSSLAGSGWTVIQRRQDGTVSFNRNWTDYRLGFGDHRGEFFIGLEKLHLITKSQTHELYIYLEDFEKEHRYARYSEFQIANEAESYELKILGEYSGNAGDPFARKGYAKFSTPDMPDDAECAVLYKSGWWYYDCHFCNLNGLYTSNRTEIHHPGIMWNSWHYKSIKFVQIMIRPTAN